MQFLQQEWCYFSHQVNFEGSDEQSTFFFSVLCGKARKDQNILFGYKKGSKSKRNIIATSSMQII